jgi:hypothetical protein
VKGNAGTSKSVCPLCHAFAVSMTDCNELTELQKILIRIVHRRH